MSSLPDSDPTGCAYNDLSRKDVRSLIFHILYAMDAFEYQEPLSKIVDNLNRGFDRDIPLDSEAVCIVQAIIDSRDSLDEVYKPFLANWNFDRISVCTKLILRFGVWELLNTNTDPRIIINEAIELAKCFAENDAHRFINGILDAVHKAITSKNDV